MDSRNKGCKFEKKSKIMKTCMALKKVAVLLVISLLIVSCNTHISSSRSGKISPGHAKKMSGSKSAKAYAPGQQKKKR